MNEKRRERSDAVVRQGGSSVVADAGNGHEHRALGKNARCPAFAAARLDSPEAMAKFAAAAGVDILNGEPIAGLKALNRLDETALRFRDLELRRQMFAHLVGGAAAGKPKVLTG